jgi:hypothetical protein
MRFRWEAFLGSILFISLKIATNFFIQPSAPFFSQSGQVFLPTVFRRLRRSLQPSQIVASVFVRCAHLRRQHSMASAPYRVDPFDFRSEVRPGKASDILHSVNYASKSGEAEGEPTVFVRIIRGIM